MTLQPICRTCSEYQPARGLNPPSGLCKRLLEANAYPWRTDWASICDQERDRRWKAAQQEVKDARVD